MTQGDMDNASLLGRENITPEKTDKPSKDKTLSSAKPDKPGNGVVVKQGSYGKVPIHSASKASQLKHPQEILAGLFLKFVPGALKSNLKTDDKTDVDLRFCDIMLGEVSRSFAAVIRQLPRDMAIDVLVFYIVLRALDTIEDDMEAFKSRSETKQDELRAFGKTYLGDEDWSMTGVGEGKERELLEGFSAVSRLFNRLSPSSQEVVRDITIKMGAGMAEFVDKDMKQGTVSIAEYNRYCHIVAGLVGEGLSRLFVSAGLETSAIYEEGQMTWSFSKLGLANSMGLLLQKTNIIRDYLEDYVDGRAFWPKEVYQQFASDLGEFAHGSNTECLNCLVANALELVPDSLEYLARLKTPEVFRFCAIPQVMAIATLAECFNNPKVNTGVVKIRKGFTARLILDSSSLDGVFYWFHELSTKIARDCPKEDPSHGQIVKITGDIIRLTGARASASAQRATMKRLLVLVAFFVLLIALFIGFPSLS
jgi:farnesyl-diphosphate farnesyltransferase